MPPSALSVLRNFSASVTAQTPHILGRVDENFKADNTAAEMTQTIFKDCFLPI